MEDFRKKKEYLPSKGEDDDSYTSNIESKPKGKFTLLSTKKG